jgi:hypothetical protein
VLLRQSALANRPWEHATGPRTAAGEARAARNGTARQKGEQSVREVWAQLDGLCTLIGGMAAVGRLPARLAAPE